MPEGDTILRAARTLRRAMAGHVVTRFESVFPHLTRVHEDASLTGQTLDDVQAAGKHLLFVFSNGMVLRSHLRMNGRWHLYDVNQAWRRAAPAMRVLIATERHVAVGFNLVDTSFHPRRTLLRDSPIGALGPDLLGEPFDEAEAVQRLRMPPDEPVGIALLEQRRVAGIGNVYKSETLFLCGIDPFQPVSALAEEQLHALIRKARALMRANVTEGASDRIVTYRSLRRTTGRSDPGERHWVYRRRGLPCRRCGTAIQVKKVGLAARSTYWCPKCQGEGSGACG